MKKNELVIKNLSASISGKNILKNVSLRVKPGEIHAIMGPNGSGKSTLAYTLMGHPEYRINNQIRPILPIRPIKKLGNNRTVIKIGTKNIIDLPTEERARAGLFLAMQSPIAVPGVSVTSILREAYQALYGHRKESTKVTHNPIFTNRWQGNGLSLSQFALKLRKEADYLKLDETFLSRGANDGFSGGEKKKLEMLQALVLHPKYAIFDEVDTGLDVDALVIVAKAIKRLAEQETGVIIITHYQRILKYLKPDRVHILVNGSIVQTGDARLAKKIEEYGYRDYSAN